MCCFHPQMRVSIATTCANTSLTPGAYRSLASVKINEFELPIQEIKTASRLDFAGKKLNLLDAIVIAPLIQMNE